MKPSSDTPRPGFSLRRLLGLSRRIVPGPAADGDAWDGARKFGLTRRVLLFESLSWLLSAGLLCVILGALLGGGLVEFWLRPGTGWEAVAYTSERQFGLVDLADATGDGYLDRLVATESRASEPPSFKIMSSTPGRSRPNQQLYLAGRVQLPGMRHVRSAEGRHWLAALSASRDSTTIYLNLFSADSTGGYRRSWAGVLFTPADHAHNWQHFPRLQDMVLHQVDGRELAFCSITASFLGWRGVVRLDLGTSPPRIDRFPCGLEYVFTPGSALVLPDSSHWLVRQGHAPGNGNDLGGVSDTCAQLVFFDPRSGACRLRDMGGEHNSQRVLVLPDQRRLVVFSTQHMRLPDGHDGEAFLLDAWTGRVLRHWHAPGLTALWLARGQDAHDSPLLQGLVNHSIVELAPEADSLHVLWVWPTHWGAPRETQGWLVCDENGGSSRILSLDGRQRAILSYQGRGTALLEPRGPSLDSMLVHLQRPGQITSYALRRLPAWWRLLHNPAARLCAEMAAFLLLLALSWRLFRQETLLRGILDDNSQPVALLDGQDRLLFANREFRLLLGAPEQGQALLDVLAAVPPGTGEARLVGQRWIRWLRRPVQRGRRPLGSLVFGVDETTRRDADEGRRFRSLTGLITHELKTPMTPLRLGLDQLQREVEQSVSPIPPSLDRVLGRMRTELDKMSRLIRQFMAMAGERRIREQLDLVQVLRDAEQRSGLHLMTGIRCHRILPREALVAGDGEMLALVVSGLISNAAEAMERHGQLQIALTAVQGDRGQRLWTLFIEDDGPGIREELRLQVWEPGFSTRPDGYGYGLYFARRVLQDMGGQIRLERSASGGGLVRVDLPMLETEPGSGAIIEGGKV